MAHYFQFITSSQITSIIIQPPEEDAWQQFMLPVDNYTFKSRSRAHWETQIVTPNTWSRVLSLTPNKWKQYWKILSNAKQQHPYRLEELHRVQLGHRRHYPPPPTDGVCHLCLTSIDSTDYHDHLYLHCSISKVVWQKLHISLPQEWITIIANYNLNTTQLLLLNRYSHIIHQLYSLRRLAYKEGNVLDPLTLPLIKNWVSYLSSSL
ncbi:uncharacterized protein RJT21DRAFT_132418 [Scheffersomyces amazonensis]|uniref:uncharacterized protein n=1 Tax=Scheffersomyces amazonensis TaxID=1078765 RepID=UPI00315D1127